MGKGSQTTSSTSSPNPTAMSAYTNLLNQAQTTGNTPYQAYSGELVAPINAQQNTGISGINNYANFAQPYIQQAAGMATNAAAPITAAQIAQYESPYTQQVVDATQAQFNNQNAQQMQGVKGNAIAQGALGGNREAIAEAETANQQQLAQAPVIAGLQNQGYQTGLNTALTEQQAQAAGAYSVGNLGVSGQNAGLTGAAAQLGAGTQQQQTQQAQDTAALQQFLTAQAYPYQQEQWLAGIDTGLGSQMGGTSSTTGPAPSWLSQITGGLLGGASMLGGSGAFGANGWLTSSDRRVKENIQRIGKLNDGQTIYRFNYKGDPATRIGLIAQNVERHHPDAVHEINGIKAVDYDEATKDSIRRWRGGGIAHFDTGGGVAGYDTGGGVNYSTFGGGFGTPVVPYSGGKSWVPGMGISHGQGVGGAPPLQRGMQQQQPSSNPAQMGSQIGALAKAISGGLNQPTNISSAAQGNFTPSPVGATMPMGVSPETFSPTDLSGSAGAIYHRGGSVGRYASGGIANLPMHNRIMMPRGYADGGMPDIPFDPTAGGIAPDYDPFGDNAPTQFNVDPSVGDLARNVYLNSTAPLPKSAGFDSGIAGPNEPSPLDNAEWPTGPKNAPIGANEPSPLDTATWPSGPNGVPPDFAARAGNAFGSNTFAPSRPPLPSLTDQGVSNAAVPLAPLTSPGFGGQTSAPVTGMEAIPSARATDISTPTAGYADNMDRIAAAHRQIESHGNYGELGTINPKTGDRAYGAYQVMGENIPTWTKQYLGRAMTPQEFLHDPAAQDAVYKARMGQYIGQYGLNGALDHWLGMGKADFTGTTHPEYQSRFMAALNGHGSPNGVASDSAAIPHGATLVQNTPENSGVAPPAHGIDWSENSKLWPALMAAGAGMLSSRSPFPGVGVGEGMQAGLQQYSAEKQQEMKQHQIDLEAKRLSQQADMQQKELALKTMPYQGAMTAAQQAEADYHKAMVSRGRYTYQPGMGVDPTSGQTVAGMYRMPTMTDSPTPEAPLFFPNQTLTGRTQRTMTPIEIDREARQEAALEVGVRPNPNDLQYIGKPAAYDQALKNYQATLNESITRHQQEMRKRYGITNPGGATPNAAAPAAPAGAPAAGAPAAATPATAAKPVAQGKPPIVKQNGRLYNLQPDGSYLAVQ